jgi:hypothetical protein
MACVSRTLAVLLTLVAAGGCAGNEGSPDVEAESAPADLSLVPSPTSLRATCLATARVVGYPVPCPTRIPPGLRATPGADASGCALDVIGPGGVGRCHRSWRNWVIGSSETADQHLVLTATPRPFRNYAKVVNGPAWYPQAKVRRLGWVIVNGRRMRAVYAPRRTNEGSAFSDHVVLIWTERGHTYAVGFHNAEGIRQTAELDEALARGIELVGASRD